MFSKFTCRISVPIAEPKSIINKRPIREIASEESDDEDLNNKIMARKNAEKLCDNFAFQESTDSEVDTVSNKANWKVLVTAKGKTRKKKKNCASLFG